MFAPPKYEIYTKMTKKVLISIYNVANLYLFSYQKQPPYLLHLMFKTYVLTNNIKVNTTKFVLMGLMKLATKNHGAGHLPPRRFIFNWPLLTRSFLLIPHCSFLWFHAILRIMEQHTIYKCYYSYKCWICAELCEAFIFLMKNIYTYVQFEGMIYQQIVGIPMGTKQKRSTEGCSKFKSPETRQVQERLVSTLEHMQVPKWDRTRCPEE